MIAKYANELATKYNTRFPEELADKLGIKIEYRPYSNETKGYLLKFNDLKIIVVNSNFSINNQRIIIAHELGHAVLHAGDLKFMSDVEFFPTSSKMELEANKFASELLIPSACDIKTCPKEMMEGVDISVLKDIIFYKSVEITDEFVKLKEFYNRAKGA